jgi:serine/threonine protein phosphatase PrpC
LLSFFRKLFNKKPVVVDISTAPLSEEQLLTVTAPPEKFQPPHFSFGCAQSVGKQREHNEDTLLSVSAVISDGDSQVPFGLFIVADGMGGHEHGEVASSSAARSIGEYVMKRLYSSLMGSQPESQSESIQELMENSFKEAQQVVVRKAPGGGTTVTAALVIGEQVTLAHVGDSRAYFVYPDGRMQVMTHDHSVVRKLVELGQMTEKDAEVSTQRNVLYRALGQTEPFRPDIITHLFPQPGYLMLCSDGLWGVVSEDDIFKIVTSEENHSLACRKLVQSANDAGGPDNISVILVQFLNS